MLNVKLRKKIVTDISFYFWSVWLLNHTHGQFIGIRASTKRVLGFGNLYSIYQTTLSNREKTKDRENDERKT